MKTSIKLAFLGTLLAVGTIQGNAQTQPTVRTVQTITFKLTGYYQLPDEVENGRLTRSVSKYTVSNKSIISLLSTELNTIFSSKAKLLLITPAASVNVGALLETELVVRDVVNGQNVDTYVSQYFTVKAIESVEDLKGRLDPFNVGGTGYTVLGIQMNVGQADFDIQGFGKTSIQTVSYHNEPVGVVRNGSFTMSGPGLFRGTSSADPAKLVLSGTVSLGGKDVEVVNP